MIDANKYRKVGVRQEPSTSAARNAEVAWHAWLVHFELPVEYKRKASSWVLVR